MSLAFAKSFHLLAKCSVWQAKRLKTKVGKQTKQLVVELSCFFPQQSRSIEFGTATSWRKSKKKC